MRVFLAVVVLALLTKHLEAKPLDTVTAFKTGWTEGLDLESISDESDELGNPWEKSGEFEGDIILGPDESIRNGLINDEFYWPNKTLIYKIDSETYDKDQVNMIKNAIADFHKKTCIQMRERQKEDKDFVFITGKHAHGCSSHVGRQGGKQVLNLKPNEPGRGCFKKGTIIHELLHALGFYHQQSTPERDEFVKIQWENIQPGREHNFKKYEQASVSNFDVKYDYHSIMHYSAYAFSKNDEKTIVPLEEGVRIGQRKTLSSKDIVKLHHMYKCKTEYTKKTEKESGYDSFKSREKDTDTIETLFEN